MGRRKRGVDLERKDEGGRNVRIEVQIYREEKRTYYPSMGMNMRLVCIDQSDQQRMFRWMATVMRDKPWRDDKTARALGIID